jgi:carbamoyl-phosphate synthase small subunit
MKTNQSQRAVLLLKDGSKFSGYPIGKPGSVWGEICFNTGMTGYQEIYTDPSYFGQIVVNTFPHIGNYGVNPHENEAQKVMISGLVIREYAETFSRFQSDSDLGNYLQSQNLVAIGGIDTRALVRHIRKCGAMNAAIAPDEAAAQDLLDNSLDMNGLELSSRVSTSEPYDFGSQDAAFKVAVLDLGIKRSILRNMEKMGCKGRVFPAQTPFAQLQAYQPDGYFLSNGPGDPAAMAYAINTAIEMIQSHKPLFGICLGHQLIALACGLQTYKMHHGHRGLNHPIKNLLTGKSEITSQNHGFAVSAEVQNAKFEVQITHIHLNDGSLAGLQLLDRPVFSVQYHPEASPGPHDSVYLFEQFVAMMKA